MFHNALKSSLILIFCLFVFFAGNLYAGEHSWSYDGDGAPGNWGKEYPMCGQGMIQSPIDLTGPVAANLPPITFNYGKSKLHMVNNGHTIQANVDPGHSISINGMKYKLVQFHFHATSEHTVDGKYYPMEVHFVHKAENGALAVVGAFFDKGKENSAWAPVFNAFPKKKGESVDLDSPVDLASLLPSKKTYYGYTGSLTTPPCTEGVAWYVLDTVVAFSSAQIEIFRAIYDHNFRPINPKNGRLLIQSNKP